MAELKQLREEAKGFSVLYGESNDALRTNVAKLLDKFFSNVYSAADGIEGLRLFKKHRPEILITDVKLPNLQGIELCRYVKETLPDTKIIILSSCDDKEFLYESVTLGIFRYLKKPVNVANLTEVLHLALQQIHRDNDTKFFHASLKNIFNHQSSMLVMLRNEKIILANQSFLNFFGVENIKQFLQTYGDIGNVFLEHNGFLYNKADSMWLDEISQNEQKLYNVKIKDHSGKDRHFFFSYQNIPEQRESMVLTFEDVSGMNLLKLFDEKKELHPEEVLDANSIFEFLKGMQRNNTKVGLHNYYKGLSITHHAQIINVSEKGITLKTNNMQQKAIQYEKRSVLVSEALPHAVVCKNISDFSFETQLVEFKDVSFVTTSPVARKTIRLVPDEKDRATLFLSNGRKQTDIVLEDISLDALKIRLDAMPAGLNDGDEVTIDIILTLDKMPLIINTKAVLFRKQENKYSYSLVFMFRFGLGQRGEMVKYITKRQMNIIREFKGM
ncbi:response regulator [bacterium]|nr:response regulator [bacterium]